MKCKTTLARISKFKESIRNLVDNTMRFHWTHEELLTYRKGDILENPLYKKLPRWAIEYLDGYTDALMEQLWRQVVFSYVIDKKGTRATIESDVYRSISPSVISKYYGDTGCYVWRSATDKFWTQPRGIKCRGQ